MLLEENTVNNTIINNKNNNYQPSALIGSILSTSTRFYSGGELKISLNNKTSLYAMFCSQTWRDPHHHGLGPGGHDERQTQLSEGFLPGKTKSEYIIVVGKNPLSHFVFLSLEAKKKHETQPIIK